MNHNNIRRPTCSPTFMSRDCDNKKSGPWEDRTHDLRVISTTLQPTELMGHIITCQITEEIKIFSKKEFSTYWTLVLSCCMQTDFTHFAVSLFVFYLIIGNFFYGIFFIKYYLKCQIMCPYTSSLLSCVKEWWKQLMIDLLAWDRHHCRRSKQLLCFDRNSVCSLNLLGSKITYVIDIG